MSEIQRIRDQLRRAFEGPAWHGPSVMEALAGVTVETAKQRPIAAAHTIWELALHILAWQDAVRERVGGALVELGDAQDWPSLEQADAGAWDTLLGRLVESHRNLQDALLEMSDVDLDRILGRESMYLNLHGLIQHHLFHAGQISILKKARI